MNFIGKILAFLCSLLPVAARGWLTRCLLRATARKEPAASLKELFACESEVMSLINQSAVKYEGGIHPKHRLMDYHRFFIQRLKAGERVLDIGCGYGAVAFSLAKAGMVVTGVDFVQISVEEARRRYQHPSLVFVEGDITRSIPDGLFDAIVMSNVLEHLEKRVELLRTVNERIRPRCWLIRVPMVNRHWTVYMKRELGMYYYSDPTHHVEYTVESFAEEMKAAGLAVAHREIAWGEIYAEVHSA